MNHIHGVSAGNCPTGRCSVLETECPTCAASPGVPCHPSDSLLHVVFHGTRLMATTFPEDD